ncbi:exocyst complex subunit Sec15-like protein [Suhomyces tanzawaensis NRRL Y-17324]|uniref:Exocyst complex component SEC15 n=1 Tax=Suhomyces tanzawaensis NRRL Y-17324 TaxID=984487 RepID=A0A1E4SF88_9ASCO|nr:exocyst complex subunit Sec15-like protein [Suhomyces tanzawaensis NRRL Y-17324]ODV78158.1 exocyst complex subunit Sec15-like protein [Suhomyces tanzawaensis NRRL Y-17324]
MPPVATEDTTKEASPVIDTNQLENLLLRDEDIFQTSLNSQDYLESLSPIIQDAIKANGLSELINKLNNIVKDKDEELTTLSLNSTEEINQCIDNIDKIHDESLELNKSLLSINQLLNKSVHELLVRKKNLLQRKEVNIKINETQIVLNLCIQVLEITNKIHELIKQKKYFNALKLIDEVTNVHLPKVENFQFTIKIYDSIPHLIGMIKEESFESLIKWLSLNMERKFDKIGDLIYENLFDLLDNWEALKKKNSNFLPYKLNSPIELSLRDPLMNLNLFNESSELNIDLSVLFDSILVYQTLGEIDQLSVLYNKEWLKKHNRIIYPITATTSSKTTLENLANFSTLGALQDYLKKIASLFTMDKHINLITKFQLRSNDLSNDLWESFITKLKPVLINFLRTHKFKLVQELTDVKDVIGNFLQIMEMNNYNILEIYEVMIILFRDYFAPLIILDFRLEFIESIQSDHYMPLIVDKKADFDNIIKICWYDKNAQKLDTSHLPITFPFSEDYVHYCLGIRSLLEEIIQFINQHYSYDQNELNNIIVNDVFEKVLSEERGVGISNDIEEFIEKNSMNKEITSQSYTNLEYYLYSVYEIGKLINRRLRIHTGIGIHNIDINDLPVLKAVENFKKLRKYSESVIFSMVDGKIRELLELVEYDDWLPTESNAEANYSIKDFAQFLENLFSSIFSTLPKSIRTLGLFRTYDFVAENFLNVLKDTVVYNRIAIGNFDLDVQYIEESMKRLYKMNGEVDGEGDGNNGNVALETTFTELRQCIDLLKLDNYDDFTKNPTFRMRNFDRIRYEDGLRLIGKMQGYEDLGDDPNRSLEDNQSFDQQSNYDTQSLFSTSTASKFAKFSSRFKKNVD